MQRIYNRCRRPFGVMVVAAAAGLLAACAAGSLVGIGPTHLDAKIVAASNVNPDDSGRASPVVIRIYELKKADTFQDTDFFSLYDKESATLGQDMNGREEVELQPKSSKTVKRKLQPDTQYIGVMAAFRDIDQAHWRAVYKLSPHRTNAVTIKLGRDSVSIVNR